MKVIKVTSEEEKREFLALPAKLYGKDHHQDTAVVRQFLDGTHPLSDDALISHFLLRRGSETCGRMTLSQSPGQATLFLGYFECIDDQLCAEALFQKAREEAARLGLTSITGPVDVSFWVGYRLKLDQYDRVYMGEPQNQPWYPRLFETAGFAPISQYVSHYHGPIPADNHLTRFRHRSELMRQRGIRLIHPDFKKFDQYLADIHGLLMVLYADFPAFSPISVTDFQTMFHPLKTISDPELIVLAYDGDRPVGFFISFPDYGNGLLTRNLFKKLGHLFRVKHHPRHIILSYSGVAHGYEGLSGALYYETLMKLKARGLPAVSTLMQRGKVTAGFEKDLVIATTHYALYRWDARTIEPEDAAGEK